MSTPYIVSWGLTCLALVLALRHGYTTMDGRYQDLFDFAPGEFILDNLRTWTVAATPLISPL